MRLDPERSAKVNSNEDKDRQERLEFIRNIQDKVQALSQKDRYMSFSQDNVKSPEPKRDEPLSAPSQRS